MGEATESRNGVETAFNDHFKMAKPEDYIPLITAVMRDTRVCAAEIARRTGISKTIIRRSLSGQRKLVAADLSAILEALDIDQGRANLALCWFHGWQSYFDQDVQLVTNIVDVIGPILSSARSDCPRSDVGVSAARVLAKRLSDMIAKHDAEAYRRQQEQPLYGI